MSLFLKKYGVLLLLLGILIFAWYNPLYTRSLSELEKASEKSIENLAILESLYLVSEASSSVRLPFISGIFEGASKSINSALEYLLLGVIILLAQLIILKITHSKVVLVLLMVLWVIALFKKRKTLAYQFLIFGLFLNPGLSIFASGISYIDHKLQISGPESLHSQLTLIHSDFMKKEQKREEELKQRKEQQMKQDSLKGKDHLTLIQRIEDKVEERAPQIGLHFEEDFRLTKKAIQFAAKKIRQLVVNYLTSVLILYLLLPLLYFVLAIVTVKSLFTTSQMEYLKNKMIYAENEIANRDKIVERMSNKD